MLTKKPINILLIEDNPADAKLVEVYLGESPLLQPRITRVAELRKGMLMLEEQDFDVVLLDLTLPDSAGFDTVKTILREFPGLTVIVMTGLEDNTVAVNSVKEGAQDFIVKGQFDSNLLSRTITYAIERSRLQNKLEDYAKAIRINEQRLMDAQNMARMGNWELDVVNNQMFWSDEVFRILGYKEGTFEPTLSDYLKPIHQADLDHVRAALNRTMEKGQAFQVEYKIMAGGNVKTVANRGMIQKSKLTNGLCLAGTIQDISAFPGAQQVVDLQAVSEKLRKALTLATKSNTDEPISNLIRESLNLLAP